MKSLIIALCFGWLAFAGANNLQGQESRLLLYQTDKDQGGGTNLWWLSLSRVEQLPKWLPDKPEPPVSQTKALKIARKWITSQGGWGGDVEYILLSSVNPDEPSFRSVFYYRIRFGFPPYKNHVTCIILMDGTVLEPELHQSAAKEAPPASPVK
jgi:hypothetical protein